MSDAGGEQAINDCLSEAANDGMRENCLDICDETRMRHVMLACAE